MIEVPMISIKSKILQDALGVTQTRTVKEKLLRFGLNLIDGEYVSVAQWQAVINQKIKNSTINKELTGEDHTPGSSFADLV